MLRYSSVIKSTPYNHKLILFASKRPILIDLWLHDAHSSLPEFLIFFFLFNMEELSDWVSCLVEVSGL